MLQNKKKHKIIILSNIIIIMVILSVAGYYLYPLIMQNSDKKNIIDVAKGNPTQTMDAIDFEGLKAINSDTVGWIYIEGTPMNYPVVQTDNNNYYLSHNFTKEEQIDGTIFLDYTCEQTKVRNSILYGHYMADESMFGVLWQYQEELYYKEHPIIQYDRPDDQGKWEIFSVYTTEADYDYRQPEFTDDDDFLVYMNRIKEHSLYDTGVVLNPTDEVITLSTCIYTFDDARFAVHARKITK